MGVNFWSRIEEATSGSYTRKQLAANAKIAVNTIAMWKSRHNFPTADVAVRVAYSLGTTVEFLIDGESGAEYVRTIVAKEGKLYRPPERIASIVQALDSLGDDKLETVRVMVVALAGEVSVERAEGS